MKVIKPQRLGVLARTFEHDGAFHFGVSVLAFFSFEAPQSLLTEIAMWKFLPQELGKDVALDAGIPKSRSEVLLTAKAYPVGGKPQAACSVRLRLGSVDKTLYAVGERFWKSRSPDSARALHRVAHPLRQRVWRPGLSAEPAGQGLRAGAHPPGWRGAPAAQRRGSQAARPLAEGQAAARGLWSVRAHLAPALREDRHV